MAMLVALFLLKFFTAKKASNAPPATEIIRSAFPTFTLPDPVAGVRFAADCAMLA
jgi:hypothetical protein